MSWERVLHLSLFLYVDMSDLDGRGTGTSLVFVSVYVYMPDPDGRGTGTSPW